MIKAHRYAIPRALTIAIVFTSSACKPPAERVADQLETSASWLAAIDMAERAWMENRVPVRFARQLVDEGRSSLNTSARSIADARAQTVDAESAGAELARAVATVDTVLAALDRRDSAAVARVMPVIAAQRETIDSMAKRAKSISK